MNMYRKKYLDFKRKQDEKVHGFLDKYAIFALSEQDLYCELEKTGWPESCITKIANFLWLPDVYIPDMERTVAETKKDMKEFLEIEDNFLAMALYAFDRWDIMYNGYRQAIEFEIGLDTSEFSEKQTALLNEAIDIFIESKFRKIDGRYE